MRTIVRSAVLTLIAVLAFFATPAAQTNIISRIQQGWLVGAASDQTSVFLGADGIPYLKVAPGGAITFINGSTLTLPTLSAPVTIGALSITSTAISILSDTVPFTLGASSDVSLSREAADHLFQRRTTNAQRLSVANTYASTISYEAFSIDWQSVANTAIVGTRTAATGTGRTLRLASQTASGADVYVGLDLDGPNAQAKLASYSANGTAASRGFTTDFFTVGQFTNAATSGTPTILAIRPTYNQASGNAANTDLAIARTETTLGSGTQLFLNMLGGAAGTTQRYAIDNTGKTTVYSSVATAGQGVDVIRASATTGTVSNSGTASIATWTPGAADVEVEVGCRVNITVSTTHSFSCDVTYTDVGNTARTRVLEMFPITGTPLTSGLMTAAVGAGDFASAVTRIGVKASTAITVRTSSGGTFTTVTYTASGTIKQVQ